MPLGYMLTYAHLGLNKGVAMKRTKGFIEIGLLVFYCAVAFMGAAAVKSQNAKVADSEQVKVAAQ